MKRERASQALDPFLPPLGEASAQLLGWHPGSSRTCLSETSTDLHVHVHRTLQNILDVCTSPPPFPAFLPSLFADFKNQQQSLDF